MRIEWIALMVLLASACGLSHSRPQNSESDAGPDAAVEAAVDAAVDATVLCVSSPERCADGGIPCCEGFCDTSGYGFGVCTPQRPDGQFCTTNSACLSGRCEEGLCGGPEPAECVSAGDSCGFAASCCDGTECRFLTYGVSTCVVPLPDGSACVYSAECASHRCADGLCRPLECQDETDRCDADHECCRGACAGGPSDGAYGWGSCIPLVASGSACVRDGWCESRSCVDGLCE